MAAPARKPRPPCDPAGETPRLRRRLPAARPAGAGDPAHPSGARSLQHRLAAAFTAPAGGRLETLLMKLIIVAAACLVLRTAIFGGAATGGLIH